MRILGSMFPPGCSGAQVSRRRRTRRRTTAFGGLEMTQRFLLMSVFVLFSSIIGDTSKSTAATNDPASFVGDLGTRAIAAMRNGDTASAKQERFRQLFRQYFDEEACARFALGTYWRTATALQRREFVELYEDYVVVSYSAALPDLGGASFEVLGSQSDREGIIVSSRVQISGGRPIGIDWRLKLTNHGYKVTDVIVNSISTATTQHSDLISFIQRHNGDVPSFLIALREKNASNGFLR
jgi:phospholipid transport system substrate-binding protein